MSFICQRHMHTHDVLLCEHLFQRFFTHIIIRIVGFIFVVGYHIYVEAIQTTGKGTAHIAIANDADGLAWKFYAAVFFTIPNAFSHLLVGSMEFMQEVEQHAKRVFGNGLSVSFGRIKTWYIFLLEIFNFKPNVLIKWKILWIMARLLFLFHII